MDKPTKAQLAAWRTARVQSYADRLSVAALAQMVVELEDDHGCLPEFEINDEWRDILKCNDEGRREINHG